MVFGKRAKCFRDFFPAQLVINDCFSVVSGVKDFDSAFGRDVHWLVNYFNSEGSVRQPNAYDVRSRPLISHGILSTGLGSGLIAPRLPFTV